MADVVPKFKKGSRLTSLHKFYGKSEIFIKDVVLVENSKTSYYIVEILEDNSYDDKMRTYKFPIRFIDHRYELKLSSLLNLL